MKDLIEVEESFKKLRLSSFVADYNKISKEIMDRKINIHKGMLKLCEQELSRRYDLRVKKLIRGANFPKIKTLAMLDYKKTPRLPKDKVEKLSTCEFIKEKRNVILIGDSGGGKTHLSIALGIETCRNGLAVQFFTASQLVNILIKSQKEGTIEDYLKKLKKMQVIIIDEVGYVPFSKEGAQLLFRIISDRYECGSIIISSNIIFSRWTELFYDKTMTTALLDRIIHKATIIKYDWGSVRLNETNEDIKLMDEKEQ